MSMSSAANPRQNWLGADGADDRGRSTDEVRIIREMAAQEVELFLTANPVDTGSANQLRREPPHIALAVMDRGPLRSCRDPSGVIVARIRDAKRGNLGPNPNSRPSAPAVAVDPKASEIDQFLMANRVDTAAVASLKSESLDIQRAVMAKGPLTNANNPSASLMARIRIVKEEPRVQTPFGMMTAGAAGGSLFGGMQSGGSTGVANNGMQTGGGTGNGAGQGVMVDAALRAIQSLVSGDSGAPKPPPPTAMDSSPVAAASPPVGKDQQLQAEAMKAIEALNRGGGAIG